MDDKAWLEQYNLLSKIAEPGQRTKFIALLKDLQSVGYELVIYPQHGGNGWVIESPVEFIELQEEHRRKSKPTMVSIELSMKLNASENSGKQLPAFVLKEFKRLLPLYNFASWHSKHNNYLKGF